MIKYLKKAILAGLLISLLVVAGCATSDYIEDTKKKKRNADQSVILPEPAVDDMERLD